MEDKLFNMKNLVIFLIAVIALIILIRVLTSAVNPMGNSNQENPNMPAGIGFVPEMIPQMTEGFSDNTGEKAYEPVNGKNMPNKNPQTGMLVEGPGFEVGELEGAGQPSLPNIPANYYYLDDGAGGEMSIQNNLCSKSCCSEQWPTPFKMKYDPYVCQNKSEFVPSNTFCSNSFQDAGCLCLSKKQNQFIYNRGGNGNEWF